MLYDISITTSEGKKATLSDYRGQVLLIVNTASRCGFTPQLAGLESLYERHKDQGFTVLGVPCNQFGGQEPLTDEKITAFCSLNYGVTFPLLAKTAVRGDAKHPLFAYLIDNDPEEQGSEINWNFEKFLIGRDGVLIGRYRSRITPDRLEAAIEQALKAGDGHG